MSLQRVEFVDVYFFIVNLCAACYLLYTCVCMLFVTYVSVTIFQNVKRDPDYEAAAQNWIEQLIEERFPEGLCHFVSGGGLTYQRIITIARFEFRLIRPS